MLADSAAGAQKETEIITLGDRIRKFRNNLKRLDSEFSKEYLRA